MYVCLVAHKYYYKLAINKFQHVCLHFLLSPSTFYNIINTKIPPIKAATPAKIDILFS